jgi:hypothetical protein
LLFSATALAAAKMGADCRLQQPIFVAGALRAATGLGECARIFHDAYRSTGAETYGIDLSRVFRQDVAVADFKFEEGRHELLHPGNACLVPAALIAARDPQRTYDHNGMCWGEPSIESAAQYLRQLKAERTFATALGKRAQQDAAELFSPILLPHIPAPLTGSSAAT